MNATFAVPLRRPRHDVRRERLSGRGRRLLSVALGGGARISFTGANPRSVRVSTAASRCTTAGATSRGRRVASDRGEVDRAICALGSECSLTLTTVGKRTCDGDSAVICNRGRVNRVDCKVLGFTGCLVIPERSKVICMSGVQ